MVWEWRRYFKPRDELTVKVGRRFPAQDTRMQLNVAEAKNNGRRRRE